MPSSAERFSSFYLCGNFGTKWLVTAPKHEVGDADLFECFNCDEEEVDLERLERTRTLKLSLSDERHRRGIRMEIAILQFISTQPYEKRRRFPSLSDSGFTKQLVYLNADRAESSEPDTFVRKCKPPRPFLILENVSPNLAELRGLSPTKQLDMPFALKLAIGCIEALSVLHSIGFVHRFVTPSNFSLRLERQRFHEEIENDVVLTNLSFARRFPRRPRAVAPMVGSVRYCSVRAHQMRELGPVDDFWSVFYMIVEWIDKRVPWHNAKSTNSVRRAKEQLATTKTYQKMPKQVRKVMGVLENCHVLDPAPTEQVCRLLKEAYQAKKDDYKLPAWLPTDS